MAGVKLNILILILFSSSAAIAGPTPFFITESAEITGALENGNRRPSSVDTFKHHSCASAFKDGALEFLKTPQGQTLKREVLIAAPALFAEAEAINLSIDLTIPLLEGGAKIGQPTREDISIYFMEKRDPHPNNATTEEQRPEASVENFAISRRLGGAPQRFSTDSCKQRGHDKTKNALQDALTNLNNIRDYTERVENSSQ